MAMPRLLICEAALRALNRGAREQGLEGPNATGYGNAMLAAPQYLKLENRWSYVCCWSQP